MGAVADKYAEKIILTDEDPYDEKPEEIVREIAEGIKNKKPEIIIDRRIAIRRGIAVAKEMTNTVPPPPAAGGGTPCSKVVVLITGKGTDPNIARENGRKEKWSDAQVAKEEVLKILQI